MTLSNNSALPNLNVLLIEDDPDEAFLIDWQLQEKTQDAFEVRTATSLKEADSLCRAKAFLPEVILLDLNLPDSTGAETVSRCRGYFRDVPIVVLTGLDDVEAANIALESGAEDYLTKGVEAWILRKAVRYALIRHQRDAHERLAYTVFQHSREAIIVTDAEDRIISVNQAFTGITGFSAEEVLGATPTILRSGHHDAAFYEDFWKTLNGKGHWEGEFWNRRKDGRLFVASYSITRVEDAAGNTLQYVGLFSDITQQKEAQNRVESLAYRDPLTGLGNRTLFNERLQQMQIRAKRHAGLKAVIYLDLDGFKPVNDTHGHVAGDALLVAVAERMQQLIREEDTLARLGGDEFAILVEMEHGGEEQLYDLLEACRQTISQAVNWRDQLLSVSASIGGALTFCREFDGEHLLELADESMYAAKKGGKNKIKLVHYEPSKVIN
ncbi:GGDEF domain-containing response regulator [Marinospirillum perlucidum]|uniref:GGDEF domain-containing response regulator n=1 Tax=Marinospirillum perlucidum TaxID=1982602 RepID=UPI000DF1C7EF|nr:diguanylate cyclase [Marinospirillum perlucidum]